MKLVSYAGKVAFALKRKGVPKTVKKILFIKTGALGDVLLTTPLVRAIRKAFPYAVIEYAVGKSYAEALKGNLHLDNIIPFDEQIFYDKWRTQERRQLHENLAARMYDVIFVLDKHWAFCSFASKLGGFRVGFDRNGEGFANNANVIYRQTKHEILAYLDLGIFFGTASNDTRIDLTVSAADEKEARNLAPRRPYLCIAPGGGNPGKRADINAMKRWPRERYLAVVDALSKKYPIVIAGGKHDRTLAKWMKDHGQRPEHMTDATGAPITVTAALCRRAKFVLTNDSGTMHIAAAVTDRIVALFGPSNPLLWAPMRGTIVWKERESCEDMYGRYHCEPTIMDKIAVEDVLDAARRYS